MPFGRMPFGHATTMVAQDLSICAGTPSHDPLLPTLHVLAFGSRTECVTCCSLRSCRTSSWLLWSHPIPARLHVAAPPHLVASLLSLSLPASAFIPSMHPLSALPTATPRLSERLFECHRSSRALQLRKTCSCLCCVQPCTTMLLHHYYGGDVSWSRPGTCQQPEALHSEVHMQELGM